MSTFSSRRGLVYFFSGTTHHYWDLKDLCHLLPHVLLSPETIMSVLGRHNAQPTTRAVVYPHYSPQSLMEVLYSNQVFFYDSFLENCILLIMSCHWSHFSLFCSPVLLNSELSLNGTGNSSHTWKIHTMFINLLTGILGYRKYSRILFGDAHIHQKDNKTRQK